ncbi:MAG: ATPase, T2SS/T4P/T4SS family [Gammaproteobacteria bacterium]|nr:ATPase, T2SS/T4P/T4SS family [Gammaproteobacteria bacterium]MDH5693583.1 ATPase, T2SS/T4P/T4SS family [Gammaproteobacteria bacterium]
MAKPIGVLLKEEGYITEQMIKYALRVQKATGDRLGDALLKLRLVNDTEIAQVLAKQSNQHFQELHGMTPIAEALKQVPYNFATKHEVLPLEVTDGKLLIAISDPFDDSTLSRLGVYSSYPLEIRVSPASQIRRLTEQFYYFVDHPLDDEIEKALTAFKQNRNFELEKLTKLLLSAAIQINSSDIHISATDQATLISYRIDGILQLRYSFPISIHSRLSSSLKVSSNMDIAELHRPQDGRMSFTFLGNEFDLRVSCIPTTFGDNIVIRVLSNNDDVKSLEQLGYSAQQLEQLTRLVNQPSGLVLATGPTGSGKSTTLYGLLRKVNAIEKNVLTIEDPVEYSLPLARQVSVNEKAGITFSSSIRSFLRQDPDVMLIGEIRDEETAQLAIRASQTGHLVLSTLHTNDATASIARLRDLDVSDFLISSSVSCIIAQRLLRKLCDHCKEPDLTQNSETDMYYKAAGCDHCHHSGYVGRIAVAEILELNDELRRLIDKGASPLDIRQFAIEQGFIPLYENGHSLAKKGVTDMEEVNRVLSNESVQKTPAQSNNISRLDKAA